MLFHSYVKLIDKESFFFFIEFIHGVILYSVNTPLFYFQETQSMAQVSKKNHLCEGLCLGKEIFPNRLHLKTLFPAWHCHLQDPQSLQVAK